MQTRQAYSDVAIVIGMRVKAVELGRRKGRRGMVPMTAAWWDEHRDPVVHPPSSTIIRRWGSWTKACEHANVPVREFEATLGRPQKWTDEEMLGFVAEFLNGKRRTDKTYAAFDAWTRQRKARPSGAAVLKRFRTWRIAKSLALKLL